MFADELNSNDLSEEWSVVKMDAVAKQGSSFEMAAILGDLKQVQAKAYVAWVHPPSLEMAFMGACQRGHWLVVHWLMEVFFERLEDDVLLKGFEGARQLNHENVLALMEDVAFTEHLFAIWAEYGALKLMHRLLPWVSLTTREDTFITSCAFGDLTRAKICFDYEQMESLESFSVEVRVWAWNNLPQDLWNNQWMLSVITLEELEDPSTNGLKPEPRSCLEQHHLKNNLPPAKGANRPQRRL